MVFADGFDSYPVATWAAASSHGNWYVDFNGGGTIQIINASGKNWLRCEPQASTSPGETHAPLVTSPSFYRPNYIHAEFVTRAQLRTGSAPNAWEVGWLLFNYTSTDSFYYVTLKPNGWELGKEYNLGAGQQQQFLATGSSPTYAVGNSLQLDIDLAYTTGATEITVKAKDGTGAWQTLTTYTDDGSTVSGDALQHGKVGLYNEDARVDWGAVAVTTLIPELFSGTLEVELTAGTWTDITSYVSYNTGPIKIRQGRATEYDTVTAGVMSLTLWNDDGRFMPGNGNGAYWPNWGKHKRIRWKVTKDGATYTRFVGWIQAIAPEFPTDSTNGAVVSVTATDALGLLSQRKLRSNLTEISLWRGKTDSTWCDAWEGNPDTTGIVTYLTNFSSDAAASGAVAAFNAAYGALQSSSSNDVEIGGVVSVSGTVTCRTLCGIQSGALQIMVHVKGPASLVSSGGPYVCSTFHTSTGGGSALCHLSVDINGSNNGMWLRNAANTSNLGLIGNLPFSNWVRITAVSRVANNAHSDWTMIFPDGTTTIASDMAIDVRTIRSVEYPGSTGNSLASSWGGIVGLGTRTAINYEESFPGASQGTLSGRLTELHNVLSGLMPITISQTGTLTDNVLTGHWAGRWVSDVLQEMLATYSGLAWARSRDSVIYAIGSDQLYPDNVVVTIDTDADCIGAPSLVDGAEMQPSRVDVAWPGGTAVARDGTLETNGVIRSKSISTVATDSSVAAAAGQAILDRGIDRTRISRIVVDLLAAQADPTAALFDEGTTLGGLFPTQRVRLWVPESHFGVPTTDVHVQGWEESYSPDGFALTLDTTPAISTLLIYEEWTGSNGSAWNGSIWSTTGGGGASGSTVDVQSNRGRLLAGAGGDVWKRLTAGTAADVEITGLFTLGSSTAEAQVVWRSDTTLANCYYLGAKVSGGLFINKVVSGSFSSVVSGFGPTIAASTDYRYRIRHQGSWLTIRVWAASGTEPGPWDAIGQESTFLGAGYIALRQWTASQAATFDDLDLYTGA